MKRSVCFCILLLLAISIWSLGPTTREAKALTEVNLTSPGDSTKIITATPTFKWKVDKNKPEEETPSRFHIKLALDPNFTSIVWEDSTIEGSEDSTVYDGITPLVEWQAYYWTMRVEVDSQTTREVDSVIIDTTITYWQDFGPHFTFFYTTATVFHIPTDLPTIQEGIVWAASGDVVLVEEGIYYENLRFYKKNLLVTSNCCANPDSIDTTIINKTIIDGSKLTRGEEKGSVVYFASGVDSSSALMGFIIRGGTGTKADIGGAEKINGGGIFCDEGSSPTIVYNVITGNQTEDDGGGIFINSAAPNILHNIITNNSAKGSGGAIQCFYSIKIKVGKSAGLSPDEQKGENKKKASSEKSESGAEIKESPSPSKSRLKMSEDEMKNSLNPRDATDVSSPTDPGPMAKPTQNEPPVAVVSWYAKKDTIIQRDKYLPGDTLVFDGTGSWDPDSASGDYIWRYKWQYLRDFECWREPSGSPNYLSNNDTCFLAITELSKLGIIEVYLQVIDAYVPHADNYSDTITINVQYPPHADAGEAGGGGIGDTCRLDGSESCDINPGDVLTYHWTQLSGPVSVTIEDPDSVKAYFVTEDSTYLGTYEFQLRVSDSMGADSATVQVTISRPPVAFCQDDPLYGDTLVGFTTSDTMILDASSSYDPDQGDQVKYFLWEPVEWCYPTKEGIKCLSFSVDSLDPEQAIQPFFFGYEGLLKFRLRVRDSYGVMSENYDSVFFSIQACPFADAGQDTLLRPGTRAYLTGTGFEINPDQRNSLKYNWKIYGPISGVTIYSTETDEPSDTVQSIYFKASVSGVYKLELIVNDHFCLSESDEVIVVANQLPIAKVVNRDHASEGDTVNLDASASYDPDSAVFQHPDSSDAGGLTFSWRVKDKPAGAEEPVIVDADQPIAKFIPYSVGTYKFEVLVNDTLSVEQPPAQDTNIAVLTVKVDSTYAYPIIQGNLISHNSAGAKGGGIDCNQSSPDIISNIFYKNQSKLSGGAICCRYFSTPQIRSNIFFGNISSDSTGGAIADLGAQLAPSATRGFRKNLGIQCNDFWDNRGGTLYQVSGNTSDNIYDFPRLIDPDFGDFRFECSSPCLGDSVCPDIGSLIYFQSCDTVKRLGMVSLSLFQNPVATAVAHFIVNTDIALKAPPVAWVTIGAHQPSPVFFVPISSGTYRGRFVFTASGIADISVFASSVVERDTIATRNFSVEFIGAGKVGKLVSYDKKVQVLFPEASVKEEIYATCISVSEDSRYQFKEKQEMTTFGEAYQLGPSISFEKDLIISFPLLGNLDLKDKDKTLFSVYKYEDGKWNKLESFLDGNSVCAKVKSLGVYRLIYDATGKHITGIPKTYQLFQNYPNPFNPETQIRYDLPVSGQVKLTIYNILGQKVKVLVDEIQDAGHKSVFWDGRDDGGREVASGIYFYKIKAQNYLKTKKMILLK